MAEERLRAADELTSRLNADPDVLAVAMCDDEAADAQKDETPLELLVIVSVMPFDLDMFGRRQLHFRGLDVVITYYRPERLRAAIDDEAGCWLISGMVLYSRTLYDPKNILFELRKSINSVPEQKRRNALDFRLNEASAYPSMVFGRRPVTRGSMQEMLLKDHAPLARALFLANSRPPKKETSVLEDVLSLPKLPPSFKDLSSIIDAFEVRDLRKFKQAQRGYARIIAEIKELAKES